jgi:hypothetical protein
MQHISFELKNIKKIETGNFIELTEKVFYFLIVILGV